MFGIQARKYFKGFILIELLTVIAIIGVLAGIITASLSQARLSGRDAKRIADIKNIQLSLALYYNDNFKFPSSLSHASFVPVYLSSVPKDPNGQPYIYAALAPGFSGSCNNANKYHLGAILESPNNSILNEDAALTLNANGYSACVGSSGDFYGESTTCSTDSASSPDLCFDVTSN